MLKHIVVLLGFLSLLFLRWGLGWRAELLGDPFYDLGMRFVDFEPADVIIGSHNREAERLFTFLFGLGL